jgi:hypothetical protein
LHEGVLACIWATRATGNGNSTSLSGTRLTFLWSDGIAECKYEESIPLEIHVVFELVSQHPPGVAWKNEWGPEDCIPRYRERMFQPSWILPQSQVDDQDGCCTWVATLNSPELY